MSDQRGTQAERASDTLENNGGSGTTHPRERDSAETAEVEASTGNPTVEIGTVFEILKNKRRRYVLRYLVMADKQATVDDLAEQIAAWECDKSIRAITPQERKRAYVSLYQNHLPKMDDVFAISYDKPKGEVNRGNQFDRFRQYLPPEKGPAWGDDSQSGLVRYVKDFV